jgi:hypothetical protein
MLCLTGNLLTKYCLTSNLLIKYHLTKYRLTQALDRKMTNSNQLYYSCKSTECPES